MHNYYNYACRFLVKKAQPRSIRDFFIVILNLMTDCNNLGFPVQPGGVCRKTDAQTKNRPDIFVRTVSV